MDMDHPMDAPVRRQCTAKSKQSGERCKRRPIVGGNVCSMHGGKTPNAKRNAARRLAAMVEPALDELSKILHNSDDDRTKLRAIENVLDRGGLPRRVDMDNDTARMLLIERLTAMRDAAEQKQQQT